VVRALTATVGRLICLSGGTFVGDGAPDAVLAQPAVREVFLGSEVSAALTGGSLGAVPAGPADGAVAGEGSEP
jgi:branched-chain amino acid transport system ATP-binding protein